MNNKVKNEFEESSVSEPSDEIEKSSISSVETVREFPRFAEYLKNLLRRYTLDETEWLGLDDKMEELKSIATASEKNQIDVGSIIASNFPSFKIPGSVNVSDRYEINEYLRKNPEIRKAIDIGCREALKEFMKDAQVSLEMFFDPESDYSYPTIYIRQKNYEENILDRIDKVTETIIPYIGGNKGWLIITTDFQFPK